MKFLTIGELTKKLGISARTAYRLVREKKIPGAFKVGGTWRFREDLFYKWIEEATSERKAEDALKGV